MAKTKQQKQEIVDNIKQKLTDSEAIVFGDYYGLSVNEMEELRNKLRENNAELVVAKKTLFNVALKEVGEIEGLDIKSLPGGFGAAFGFEDEVAPAKILAEFSEEHEALNLNGGVLEGKFIPNEQVLALAKLPSKDELIAKVVGSIKAPVSGLVGVMKGNLRNLVGVLGAIQENKS